MHLAESSSWRLDTTDGYPAELALFVRDACGLAISGPGGDVPRLLGASPDLAGALTAGEHEAAGRQWTSWWLQMLDLEFRDRSSQLGDERDRARRRIAEHEAVCDPPEFESLADRPGLQAAARVSVEGYGRWASSRPEQGRPELSGSAMDWSLIRQTAEDVAFDHHVRIDAVRASVAILPVVGTWWHRVRPGAVQCSIAAAVDPATAQALLWDAFASRVKGRA